MDGQAGAGFIMVQQRWVKAEACAMLPMFTLDLALCYR